MMQQDARVRDKVVLVGLNSPVLKKDENAFKMTNASRLHQIPFVRV